MKRMGRLITPEQGARGQIALAFDPKYDPACARVRGGAERRRKTGRARNHQGERFRVQSRGVGAIVEGHGQNHRRRVDGVSSNVISSAFWSGRAHAVARVADAFVRVRRDARSVHDRDTRHARDDNAEMGLFSNLFGRGSSDAKLQWQIFNLKFTAKSLARAAKKCESEEKANKSKVRDDCGDAGDARASMTSVVETRTR